MVHTENQLIQATVLKVQKFLQRIQQKEIITEEQFKEVKQIISSLRVHSDVNIPITENSPSPQPIYESIQNLYEPESIKSSTQNSKFLKPSINEGKVIYAVPHNKPPLINKRNRRVQLNFETFQQKVRNAIEKTIQAPLDSSTSTVMIPKICRAKLYSTPTLEKVQLTTTNIESFKNYTNSNIFNSVLNDDDSLIIQYRDAVDLTTKKNLYNKDLIQEERFVVNMFESRPSKRWQKRDAIIDLRNNLGIHDNNFISIIGASVSDNQSANIDFGVCNNNNAASDGKSECLDNYYSTLSERQGVDSTVSTINIENDIYHTIQDLESTCNQQQEGVNTNNNNNNKLTSANNFYYIMADDSLYYNVTVDQEEIKSTHGNNEAEFFRLKQEADVQCNVMKQAYKAIEACRNTKRFYNSTEKVMAEKILLLASTRHANLIQTIRASQYDNILLTPKKSSCGLKIYNQPRISKTTISNISLPLNNAWLLSNHNVAKHLNWFLVVASVGNKILSSETVLLKPGEKHIEVKQLFEFERLDAEFRVELSVFHMRLTTDEGRRFEFGCNKRVSTLCRSFQKLHYKDLQTQTLVSNCIPSSGFTKCGSIMITIHDLLSSRVNWKLTLHNPQHRSTNDKSSMGHNNYTHRRPGSILTKMQEYIIPIEDTFSMDVNIQKAALLINRSGFLTVGTKSARDTISWNRRYCVLNDTDLHFYNDPLEADFDKDCGITMSLKNSLTTHIDVASPSVCPKPKTLMLDTVRTEDNSRFRHFFKADSTQEMEAWRRDFNTILVLLKNWNELKFVQRIVTDL